ncbi:hypothetical protein FNF29_05340 [Cafeteria roenbergensis]|uniref:Uncharacterized protein n=1 Tax=Cafeteria roenbergensis TaxID=33653 RepID=A0A5A8CBU6_CAFRO|nr:hypothetical protein FNF29_05340 [Cafeteria roenbergensis]|eukprot:KAA0150328.1 hypothetical protein FNF29_05340 [Cafeteria roenbergensis]
MARARFPWLYAVLAVAASALGAKLGPAAQAGCTDPKSGIVCPSPDDPSVATVTLTVLSGHSGAFDGGSLVLQLQAPSGRAFSVPDGTTLALSLSAGLSGPSCAAHTDSVSLLGTAAALQLLDAGGVPSAPQGASELAMVNSSLSAASSPLAVVRAVPFAASPSANVAVFFSSVVLRVNASALGAPAACTSWATRELQVSEARLEFRVPASDVGAPEDQVRAAVVSVRVGRCVADAAGNDCAEEGVELVVAVRLAAGAAAEDGAGRLTVALADGSVLARWLKLAPLVGVAAVWRAGGAAVEATAGNTSPPAAPADDGMAGVYVGLALLGVTILGGCVVLVVIECTSEKDAFGRGPLEQAAAANCLCLDRSISRLNRGINGQFTSASSPDTTEVVPGSASPAAGAGAHKPAREDAKPSAGSPVTNPLAVVRPQRPRQVSPDGAAAAPPGSPP